MTKQEFLAFSLPYKLFFRIEYGSTNQPTGIYQMSGVYETSIVEGFNYDNNVKTDKLKPILHPLTDFRKLNLDVMDEIEIINIIDKANIIENANFRLVLRLVEEHFDLFGGIDSGDAIDVNSLHENPYK